MPSIVQDVRGITLVEADSFGPHRQICTRHLAPADQPAGGRVATFQGR